MTTRSISRLTTVAALVAAAVPALVVVAASTSAGDPVLHISGDRTRMAFQRGQPLHETPAYKVHASRREAAGMAEVHETDTDIIYVLDGTATVVTGGTVIDGHQVAANEIRGRAIDGGTKQRLATGDVFIVPQGVPHWFVDVDAPFLYYVVKTTDLRAQGGAH